MIARLNLYEDVKYEHQERKDTVGFKSSTRPRFSSLMGYQKKTSVCRISELSCSPWSWTSNGTRYGQGVHFVHEKAIKLINVAPWNTRLCCKRSCVRTNATCHRQFLRYADRGMTNKLLYPKNIIHFNDKKWNKCGWSRFRYGMSFLKTSSTGRIFGKSDKSSTTGALVAQMTRLPTSYENNEGCARANDIMRYGKHFANWEKQIIYHKDGFRTHTTLTKAWKMIASTSSDDRRRKSFSVIGTRPPIECYDCTRPDHNVNKCSITRRNQFQTDQFRNNSFNMNACFMKHWEIR